jgi:hypothetical protein
VLDIDYQIREQMMEVPPPCGEHAGLNCHPHIKAIKDDK